MVRLAALFRLRRTHGRDALRARFDHFTHLLSMDNRTLELIAGAEESLGGEYLFDKQYLCTLESDLAEAVLSTIRDLAAMSDNRYPGLAVAWEQIRARVRSSLGCDAGSHDDRLVIGLEQIRSEHADTVGEKSARLGEIAHRVGLRVPPGFAITARACQMLLDDRRLASRLHAVDGHDPEVASRDLVEAILELPPPRAVVVAIRRALAAFDRGTRFSVRSSAIGEDREHSFAGQFDTRLNVASKGVVRAWQEVVASLFSPRAIDYRRRLGMPHRQASMAVACLTMVPAEASGVIYTMNPADPDDPTMLVTAAYGLGVTVVEGTGSADTFRVSRTQIPRVMHTNVVSKLQMVAPADAGGVATVDVAPARRTSPALTAQQVVALASAALQIERHMKCPQDIEWAMTPDRELQILQARPLRLTRPPARLAEAVSAVLRERPMLLDGAGTVACRGVGAGPVSIVASDADGKTFQPGHVLVTKYATPRLAPLVPIASAVVTEVGAITGHMATVAREFRIPTLVGVAGATTRLRPGMEVTVDANDAAIYEGRVEALLQYEVLEGRSCTESPEFQALRRALHHIAPLSLTDPDAPDFVPEACRTYHDIIRFAHERALDELARLDEVRLRDCPKWVHRLELDVPLDLRVIDLGGALVRDALPARITPDMIASEPLRLLLRGVMTPGVWATSAADMDLEGFMASATRGTAMMLPGAVPVPRNVAIASAHYVNVNLRVGYHFNVIDAYLGDGPESSRIVFRFIGGVTDVTRRTRRARVLAAILLHHDFQVEQKGELVIARLGGVPRSLVEDRLSMLGRLVGFTRQLDIFLRADNVVEVMVDRFLKGQFEPVLEGVRGDQGMADTINVLVLDDETTVCQRLKDHLEARGMSVETYLDSRTAISRLTERQFHVVVTDLKMSGPTGLDVLVAVKQYSLPTEVIIITGYRSIEALRGAEAVGAFGFLDKPFRLEDLEAMVKQAAKKAKRWLPEHRTRETL
ncbi:MAG: response regulator [Acidobacteria bacterium]|nr:response regulator [Acidobacteriota bacterium]